MTDKLILFIDDKNLYKGARRAFFSDLDQIVPHRYGQIKPMELGGLICSRASNVPRKLHQVRIYTGSPDSSKDPKSYAAHSSQCASWSKAGVAVITRTLRYPQDWPSSKPQQKGVDVALAIDFVALAIDGEYDVGIIASTDTDLKPALEYVRRKWSDRCQVEVAAWKSPQTTVRLSITNPNAWCHWLYSTDYDAVADLVDYNIR